jgi:hypothetical protein
MSESDIKYSNEISKDEKLDKIFWFKIAYSLVIGIALGCLHYTGFLSFLMYGKLL